MFNTVLSGSMTCFPLKVTFVITNKLTNNKSLPTVFSGGGCGYLIPKTLRNLFVLWLGHFPTKWSRMTKPNTLNDINLSKSKIGVIKICSKRPKLGFGGGAELHKVKNCLIAGLFTKILP